MTPPFGPSFGNFLLFRPNESEIKKDEGEIETARVAKFDISGGG